MILLFFLLKNNGRKALKYKEPVFFINNFCIKNPYKINFIGVLGKMKLV